MLKILAPAKINLHLQVTSKRDDGFHNIISLFQMISLYDEIIIKKTNKNKIIIDGNFDFPDENNLIYKAALWMKQSFGIKGGFIISCTKNIPQGAGLGGGSSDAAATLMGINFLTGLNLENVLLQKGALALGSDVPFFLGTSTAIAEERGEKLTPVRSREGIYLIVTDTGIHSSTKEAFHMLNLNYGTTNNLTVGNIAEAYLNQIPSSWPFYNSFTPYLYSKSSDYKNIINKLDLNGSAFSSITGTGSSVFGVFGNEKLADNAKKALKESNIITHKVKMLANRPQPVYNYLTAE